MQLKTPSRKMVAWIVILFVAWFFLHEKILEYIFLFLTVGEVGGTSIRLSPEAILTGLPFVFMFIVAAIFHKELWRLARSVFHRAHTGPRQRPVAPDAVPTHVQAAATARPLPRPEIVAAILEDAPPAAIPPRRKRRSTMPLPAVKLYQLLEAAALRMVASQPWLSRQWQRLSRLAKRLLRQAILLAEELRPHVITAMIRLQHALQLAWRIIKIETVNLARLARQHAILFWRWLVPYLWQLDRWLGMQYRALLRHPYVRHAKLAARDLYRDIRRRLRQ